MSYTLIEMVDQVSGEMGLALPASVIGSAANQTIQMLALTQRLGKDLLREFEWEKAVKAYIFQTSAATTFPGCSLYGSILVNGAVLTSGLTPGMVITGVGIAPYTEIVSISGPNEFLMNVPALITGTSTLTFATQDYAMPADYDRMISDTNWDRTNHWRNLGTKSSQEWQTLQGGLISTGPRERYRVYNGNLRIFTAVTSVLNISFEYVSRYWVLAPGGTAATKPEFTLDTDTCIFKDDLMLAGLKYYFLKAKKLDFMAEMQDFQEILSACKAQDVPLPAQSLAPEAIPPYVGPYSIPDGNWPTT